MSDFLKQYLARMQPPPQTVSVPGASLMDQTKSAYPMLNNLGVQFKETPSANRGYMEFWPPGETGAPDAPRPKEFDLAKPGVDVYRKDTQPKDVMGDIASHYLNSNEPVVTKNYQDFRMSLTGKQMKIIKDQHKWSQENEGETRNFKDWFETAGLPAVYRGYAFQQYPAEFIDQFYTPRQKALGDQLIKHLSSQP